MTWILEPTVHACYTSRCIRHGDVSLVSSKKRARLFAPRLPKSTKKIRVGARFPRSCAVQRWIPANDRWPVLKMGRSWRHRVVIKVLCILCLGSNVVASSSSLDCESDLDKELKRFVDGVLSVDKYSIIPGVGIERAANATSRRPNGDGVSCGRSFTSVQDYVKRKMQEFAENHVLAVNIPATARFFQASSTEAAADASATAAAGRNSFLTGFVFIGAQLIKSMMIAMFLPSLLGGLGKLLGKGLSTFSGISGASAGINQQQQPIEDFEFKDNDPYSSDNGQDINGAEAAETGLTLNVAGVSTTAAPGANSRFGVGQSKIPYLNDNYYMRKPNKKTDFKVFHKIPSSSMLLTSYDPFYSPLLSRLDAVFQQLGLGNTKSPETEKCRERLVCLMYSNPAKYAPYSNLVSAQLSRELNELRKPSSDNPDILRFFKYMKAAKDGQDGEECLAHGGCPLMNTNQASPAILTTFNDINKLVQARKLD